MIDELLSRLQKVRRSGDGKWTACCPAHDDCHPSLAVREEADGRVLIKCFSGCSAESILGAVGLEFDALFPPKDWLTQGLVDLPKRWTVTLSTADALRCIAFEAGIVLIVGSDMARNKTVSEEDFKRLALAVERIQTALEATQHD